MSWLDDFIEWITPGGAPPPTTVPPPLPVRPPEPDVPDKPKAEPKKRKNVRRVTVHGRVVYDRKRHFFNMRSVARILKVFLEEDEGKPEDLLKTVLEIISILTIMVDIFKNRLAKAEDDLFVKALRFAIDILGRMYGPK